MSTPPSWIAGARQHRSRRTEAALARAAGKLLSEQSFESIRVTDLARQAGISVGGFYRRFRDKRALLNLADGAVLDDCRQALDEALADHQTLGMSLEEVVRAYVAVMIAKFREHRIAILQVLRHADPADAAEYRRRAAEFNAHVHGRFRELLRERGHAISHPNPEVAINLAIFFASAAARDAIWRGSLRAYPISIDDDGLIDEITRCAVAYLVS